MNAGFFKRMFSSVIDIAIIILITYLTFLIGGRPILQSQIENFEQINSAYTEIVDVYNDNINSLIAQYNAAMTAADGDTSLEDAAEANYATARAIIDQQNTIDLAPYDEPMTSYFLDCVFYFAIGFIILMSVYTVILSGKTLGRKLMQIRLEGPSLNPLSVFFHDIIFKYFFIVLVLSVSLVAGLVLLVLTFVIDTILIGFTPKKAALRDVLLKLFVVKAGYGY
ncbi:MAG: RDD family protein [Candidatus Izemoplasmatales bacterium]|jgi:hypothetical protein|nr:RDD family protein [Candidatus Izemoplasmatales bacterium]MDD3865521.1 RDD family protein [Candidatus Izemoplasmatales bacterium]